MLDPQLLLPLGMFAIIYFVLIMPMRNRQKKLEATVKALKPGDRIIVNPGIFATVVSVQDDSLDVRVDEKTRIKILKTAVAQLLTPQGEK
jgi:preprotein translocase YajC subunit